MCSKRKIVRKINGVNNEIGLFTYIVGVHDIILVSQRVPDLCPLFVILCVCCLCIALSSSLGVVCV